MEESPAIYDIPEARRVRMGIWTSLGRGLQSLARRLFGRSNRSSSAEFPYLPRLKISARSDRSNFGNLPISASLFGSVFCANTNPTQFIFFYEWDIGQPFWKNLFLGYCVFVSEHMLTNFAPFPSCRCQTSPCSTSADLR